MHQEGLAAAKAFMRANEGMKVGEHGLTNSDVLSVVGSEVVGAAAVECQADLGESPWKLHWVEAEGHGPIASGNGFGCCVPVGEPNARPPKLTFPSGSELETYSATDLDLLALYFTIAKILYIKGSLAVLPDLVRLIEPCRQRSKIPLHRTSIRNEQAYYTCLAQLISLRPFRPPPSSVASGCFKAGPPIYIFGDSHTLPPVWNEITLHGQTRLLVPALVTGLKHYHLREEGDFYPKANFLRVAEATPKGATVVFLFGEIDCREGILMAVEKCRYNSVEEGMQTTIQYFIKEAERWVSKKGWSAYIHPVIPVLNETRALVTLYNGFFRKAVDASKSLVWLDFFDDMLEGGLNLRKGLELDGTHLSPNYVPCLERALQERA
ncbi:unnamed protein product [Chrysoparadoxa australica]